MSGVFRAAWPLTLACALGGGAALLFGFALDWDLLNYHLYNPHAVLQGRLFIDTAPAQMQTYLNPALHLPAYLIFRHAHTAVLVFVTGALQGAQILLLYAILVELTGRDRVAPWVLMLVAALGLGGPIFLHELGGTQGDTLLSALVLTALLAMLREQKRPDASRSFRTGLTCGLVLGAACGFKLTLAPFGVGMFLAAFVLLDGDKRWRMTGGVAAGGLLGLAVVGGPWFTWLWHRWESPMFPYFNWAFHSSWVSDDNLRDMRFLPRNTTEWLLYPYYWSIDPFRVWEYRFRDLRLPLLFTLAALLPFLLLRRWREQAPGLVMVWLFVIVGYVLWLRFFSIYRYLAVIEMLAPLLIFSTLLALFRRTGTVVFAVALLLLLQLLVAFDRKPSTWLFQRDSQSILSQLPADAMVIIDGYEPVAYAALWLDDQIPLVRIRANFMARDEPVSRLHDEAYERVTRHRGPSYLLLPEVENEAPFLGRDLGRAGLSLGDRSGCQPAFGDEELQRLLGLRVCPLEPARSNGGNQDGGR